MGRNIQMENTRNAPIKGNPAPPPLQDIWQSDHTMDFDNNSILSIANGINIDFWGRGSDSES